MSGLFCDDPRFLYRSDSDNFMLEVYENGEICLLNFKNDTSTKFDDLETVHELWHMLFDATGDLRRREVQKREDDLKRRISYFVEDHRGFTHCELCEKEKDKDSLSWYVKQYGDDGCHFMFLCHDCANSPDGVGFVQCDPVHPDDRDDIPF